MCMPSASQQGPDLLGKKIISCAIYTLNVLKCKRAILLVNDSSRLYRYWTKGLLEMNLPVSGSPQLCIKMKKSSGEMGYNRLLHTFLHTLLDVFFIAPLRIKSCEEENKKPPPGFGDVYGLAGQQNITS